MKTATGSYPQDTIAARATAPGPAAVAIVRLSGPRALELAEQIAGPAIQPERAQLRSFRDPTGALIDRGLVLYFPGPNSFTGESVIEFQCHGAATVVDWLLESLFAAGARAAEAGEFSLRAFLNDKLDLTQAEAIADLISSGSRSAARAALRSLDGAFANAVNQVQASLTELRVLCEAWLDFPEEDLDPGTANTLCARGLTIDAQLAAIEINAGAGLVLTDGLTVALAGAPNAGKSSLLNRLVQTDAAIVSDIPGTTRDALQREVLIAGVAVQLTDTAGLRASEDVIERQGVARAHAAMETADLVLWIADICVGVQPALEDACRTIPPSVPYILLLNKSDLVDDAFAADNAMPSAQAIQDLRERNRAPIETIPISALHGTGIDALTAAISKFTGHAADSTGAFSARRRHLAALSVARRHLAVALPLLRGSLDLAAEELRAVQTALGELTGEVSSDELLGEIFSTFCIGK